MFLDFLFPRRSLMGREGVFAAQDELAAMNASPKIFLRHELRARGLLSLDRVFAMGSYQNSPMLKKAIYTFKYRRVSALADCLGDILLQSVQKKLVLPSDAVLCPVPLHFLRRFTRGFNQAELLARRIASGTHLPMNTLLCRMRSTGHQAWRGKSDRMQAMKGAFRTQWSGPMPRCVYLVDDVFTTGATLEECARILKSHGTQCVEAIVLAYD